MNNELVEHKLINVDLYKSIYNELENLPLEKKSPAGIREILSKKINNASYNSANVTATIAAFYYYSLGKNDLDFLQNYYHQTFSAYFNKQIITNHFNDIIKNDFILNAILDICDKDITSELYKFKQRKAKMAKSDPVQNKVTKYQTTKIGTFPNAKFEKLTSHLGLRRLVSSMNNDSFIKEEDSYDKIASTDKANVIAIRNKANASKMFKKISDLEINVLNGIKKSLKEIYGSYEKFKQNNNTKLEMINPKNDSRLSRLKALGGTKVKTIYSMKKTLA